MADPKAREIARMNGTDKPDRVKIPIRERVSPLPHHTWELAGSCRRSGLPPDAWFPTGEHDPNAEKARKVCTWCPVLHECLDEALAVPGTAGIWAGTNEQERQALRRRSRTTTLKGATR